jgi:hypothetical protein
MAKIMPSISPEFIELRPEPFRPYLFVLSNNSHPSSIAMAAASGGSTKIVEFDERLTPEDLPKVNNVIQNYLADFEGECPLFGTVTGFLFVSSPTDGTLFDAAGHEIGLRTGKFWPVSLSIQGGL